MLNWFLEQWRNVFDRSSSFALEQVQTAVTSQPYVDLSDNIFKANYAITWAFALILGLFVGIIAAAIALNSTSRPGLELEPAKKVFFFAKVGAFGFIAPVLYGVLLIFGQLLTNLALQIGVAEDDTPWYETFASDVATVTDPWIAFGVHGAVAIVSMVIWFEMYVIVYITMPIALSLTTAYSLSVAGKGLGFFRSIVSAAAVTVFAKPIMTFTTTMGTYVVQGTGEGIGPGLATLVIMFMVAYTPFFIYKKIKKKTNTTIVSPVVNVNNEQPNLSPVAKAGITTAATITVIKSAESLAKATGNPVVGAVGTGLAATAAAKATKGKK